MHELYEDLEDMCVVLADELSKTNDKLEKSGGQISAGDIEYIDKLTHGIKSIKTTMAMMEADSDHSYARGRGSYARGRNARRDSMGRYSREGGSYDGYSMGDDDFRMEIKELMQDAPNEQIRQKLQRIMSEM